MNLVRREQEPDGSPEPATIVVTWKVNCHFVKDDKHGRHRRHKVTVVIKNAAIVHVSATCSHQHEVIAAIEGITNTKVITCMMIANSYKFGTTSVLGPWRSPAVVMQSCAYTFAKIKERTRLANTPRAFDGIPRTLDDRRTHIAARQAAPKKVRHLFDQFCNSSVPSFEGLWIRPEPRWIDDRQEVDLPSWTELTQPLDEWLIRPIFGSLANDPDHCFLCERSAGPKHATTAGHRRLLGQLSLALHQLDPSREPPQ